MSRKPSVWEMVTGSPVLGSAYYIPPSIVILRRIHCVVTCLLASATLHISTVLETWPLTNSSQRSASVLVKLIKTILLTTLLTVSSDCPSFLSHQTWQRCVFQLRWSPLIQTYLGCQMKLVFDVETGGYTVGEEWASFVRANALRAGDTVVFVSVLGSAITHFATSRAHSQSWVRHSINLDAFSKAIGSLMQSKPVELTYSPTGSRFRLLGLSKGLSWESSRGLDVRYESEEGARIWWRKPCRDNHFHHLRQQWCAWRDENSLALSYSCLGCALRVWQDTLLSLGSYSISGAATATATTTTRPSPLSLIWLPLKEKKEKHHRLCRSREAEKKKTSYSLQSFYLIIIIQGHIVNWPTVYKGPI